MKFFIAYTSGSGRRIALLSALFLTGCAARPAHPYIDPKDQTYGPPQWHCDIDNHCYIVQMGEPSQLTPVGCFLNQWTIGLGKKAEECKKPLHVIESDGNLHAVRKDLKCQ